MAENNPKNRMVFAYMRFVIGLFIASLGVAFSVKAGLGTSPVSSIPYSMSLVWPVLTLGGWLNILSVIQITVQVLIMRKSCKPAEIVIQTILAFVYGYLTNFSCLLISGLPEATAYFTKLTYLVISCFVLAFGIWIQLRAGVAMLPGEAMNRAIAKASGKKYENVKIFFDVFYIVGSAVICFIFLGELKGVREGSVIAALAVGVIIKLYNRILDVVKKNGKDL